MFPAQSEHKSLKLFNFSNIEICLHWSVLVLLAFLGVISIHASFTLMEALAVTVGTLSLLLIHTFGHIFVVRLIGWKVTPFVIYPFGDLYTLDERKPFWQHALVTFGGLAASALVFFSLSEGPLRLPELIGLVSVKEALTDLSLLLLVLNAIPLLPSDLGRLLQLYTKRYLGHQQESAFFRFQEFLAAFLFLFGIWHEYPLLAVIAVGTLFIISREHYFHYALQSSLGHFAAEIIMPLDKLILFHHGTTLSSAQRSLLHSSQQIFPVMLGDSLLGYLDRSVLRQSVHREEDCYLSEIVYRDFPTCSPDTPMRELLLRQDWSPDLPLAVIDNDTFIGLIFYEQLIDFLLLQRSEILQEQKTGREPSTTKLPSHKKNELKKKD
ncbi:MAG: hypothetical protein KDD55_05385 [Bdellovibrionales bacterium]|nr:hypothetical protein [Bdellovibrionales bacterium]